MVTMLAPLIYVKKDHHVYVAHVARMSDDIAPTPSAELTNFSWMAHFREGCHGYDTTNEVHRRVLDPELFSTAHRLRCLMVNEPAATRRAVYDSATPSVCDSPLLLSNTDTHQPNAQRELQCTRTIQPEATTRGNLAAQRSSSGEAVTAHLGSVAANAKRARDAVTKNTAT